MTGWRPLARCAVIALLGASAVSAAPERDPLAGRTAGKPEECIHLGFTEGPQIVDQHTILYRDGRRMWKTGPVSDCPSLRPATTLVVEVFGGQLCHNDHFRVVEPGDIIPGPICRFRPFVPYDLPRR